MKSQKKSYNTPLLAAGSFIQKGDGDRDFMKENIEFLSVN
jgi:hypothetical protein